MRKKDYRTKKNWALITAFWLCSLLVLFALNGVGGSLAAQTWDYLFNPFTLETSDSVVDTGESTNWSSIFVPRRPPPRSPFEP